MRVSRLVGAIGAVGALWCASTVFGAERAAPDRIVLASGDVLFGHVYAEDDASITLLHADLGEMTVSRDRILEITLAPSAPSAIAQTAEAARAAAVAAASSLSLRQPAPPETEAEAEEPAVVWETTIEFGANGQQGNTDSTSLIALFSTKRTDDVSTFLVEASYRLAIENGNTTSNRFFARERFERKLTKPESRWSAFVQSTQEYDEFKDYDFRWTLSVGPQYDIVRNDSTLWNAYLGFGVAQELGGADEDIKPILLIGTFVEHKFNDRVSISGRAEYEPVLDDFDDYILRGQAALNVALNESGSFKLSLGVADEYQSEPGNAKNNDFYYYATIGYTF